MEYLGPLANFAIFIGFLLLVCCAYILGARHGWQDAEDWFRPEMSEQDQVMNDAAAEHYGSREPGRVTWVDPDHMANLKWQRTIDQEAERYFGPTTHADRQ